MTFSHVVGGYTFPLATISGTTRDLTIYAIGNAIQTYLNSVMGDAFKQVNHNDGYVVQNVHYYPIEFTIAYLKPQLPMVCIYRKSLTRQPLTAIRDWLYSEVVIEYVMPFTPNVSLEKRYAIMGAVTSAIESLIRRGFRHEDIDLLGGVSIEKIEIDKADFGEKSLRYIQPGGFYASEIKCKLTEVVDPATEDLADLSFVNYIIDLGGSLDGYSDGYHYSDFHEEINTP